MDVECEILKNFSSLRAVISGLQKTSISHLKNMWADVSRESSEKLKELYSHDKSLRRELMTKNHKTLEDGVALVLVDSSQMSRVGGQWCWREMG
ncbi:ral guanine nucleotide dissociation stimulator-like isoform X2 [Diceros bicornis minor]|uniref:ral guanine nucleotide dissociation stimulator-like isoform X2 n=1 Tax=Diceros bicornis minor TaxID=77932 RepID=UPI0026EDB539|nr:ral guanine nucleotide dissociation stimulator-like isoform X2 [Diceros bicornis minor]